MACPFYRKLCGTCKNHVCRGFFPEKQPYITENTTQICASDTYEKDCLIYSDAVQWREERRLKSLDEHCPFAHNTVCGKPWLWICKGATPPFFLTDIEMDPHGRTLRGEDGGLVFKPGRTVADIKDACLSGDTAIYAECPYYKEGVEYREYVKRIKKGEKP